MCKERVITLGLGFNPLSQDADGQAPGQTRGLLFVVRHCANGDRSPRGIRRETDG